MTEATLLPQHEKLVKASAISDDVARRRGYRSVTEPGELAGIFGPVQRRAPGLLIPLFNVYGEQCSYQLRPDEPRIGRNGKALKYETPRGLKMTLDCPPPTLEHVRNPKVTLWLTEGVRKADSLASVGLRALALLGVDCWRGTGREGGKTVLDDWQGVALNGRKVVVCFDSDAFEKPEIHAATERVGKWLESRGAELSFVYLPHAADGSKMGVDNYLAEHSRDELLARIERVWHPLPHDTVKPQETLFDEATPLRSTAELLVAVRDAFARFVILPSAAARLAVALWVLHTWAFDAAHCTPYLAVRSATKRAAKTRLEEVLELLVRQPWRVTAASEAAMFRTIEAKRPTLLLDEVDAIFTSKSEGTEGLRAMLNAGNRPGAAVARVVGDGANLQAVDFSVYCPKMLAGIVSAHWPDTVLDRSVVIALQRKKPSESVERLRPRKLAVETTSLRAELARWAHEHVEALREAEPVLPAKLNDRAAEGWEPLFAIAELAERESGQPWAERARRDAVQLSGGRVEDDAHGVLALAAIREVFGDRDAVHTSPILDALNRDDELPFADYRRGDGLNDRGLAKVLKPFGIRPHKFQVDGVEARGYKREYFIDAWARYCETPTPADSEASTRRPSSNHGRFGVDGWDSEGTPENSKCRPQNPDKHWQVDGSTLQNAQGAPETQNDADEAPRRSTIDYAALAVEYRNGADA